MSNQRRSAHDLRARLLSLSQQKTNRAEELFEFSTRCLKQHSNVSIFDLSRSRKSGFAQRPQTSAFNHLTDIKRSQVMIAQSCEIQPLFTKFGSAIPSIRPFEDPKQKRNGQLCPSFCKKGCPDGIRRP